MKTNLKLKIIFGLSLPILYFIISSGFKEHREFSYNANSIVDVPDPKNFINLIYTDTYFGSPLHSHIPDNFRSIEGNIINIKDSLHFNSVHVYGYGNLGGAIDDPLSYYKDYINSLIYKVDSAGLVAFMEEIR